tara:strand:+ start:1168 stop:2136 length:969 start_codon:yes stop_codon:yes gene_type:complete
MKFIDLFCGCGGLTLGLEKAGMKCMTSIDNLKEIKNFHYKNFKHDYVACDINNIKETISVINNYNFDMIVGGPPCQDFSSAGKRDESLGRADLTYKFSEIITKTKPKYFLMENVERIKKSKILKNIINRFKSNDYYLSAFILNAYNCNVPQDRKRYFLFGQLKGQNNSLNFFVKKRLSPVAMTVRKYFKDTLDYKFYYRHPRNYNRRGIFSIDEPSPTIRGVNRPVPSGYKIRPNDPNIKSLKNIKVMNTRERSLIQTFPKKFNFLGKKTFDEQLIGNAVPVNMAKLIGESIFDLIKSKKKNTQTDLFGKNLLVLPNEVLKP